MPGNCEYGIQGQDKMEEMWNQALGLLDLRS